MTQRPSSAHHAEAPGGGTLKTIANPTAGIADKIMSCISASKVDYTHPRSPHTVIDYHYAHTGGQCQQAGDSPARQPSRY